MKPYPLAFAIPLGYNQSDIIFTWQNMGSTNVNYSISLSIGNVEAVEMPLINITRSGLMPRQEQGEFRIQNTLCKILIQIISDIYTLAAENIFYHFSIHAKNYPSI